MTIPCWPSGHGTRHGDCEETLPADDCDTMHSWGWGWVHGARDDGSIYGDGPFMTCPEHRNDFDPEYEDEQRAAARIRNCYAKHISR